MRRESSVRVALIVGLFVEGAGAVVAQDVGAEAPVGEVIAADPQSREGAETSLSAASREKEIDARAAGAVPRYVYLQETEARLPDGMGKTMKDWFGYGHQYIRIGDEDKGQAMGMGDADYEVAGFLPGTQVADNTRYQHEMGSIRQPGLDIEGLRDFLTVGTPTGAWVGGIRDCHSLRSEAVAAATPTFMETLVTSGSLPNLFTDPGESGPGEVRPPVVQKTLGMYYRDGKWHPTRYLSE